MRSPELEIRNITDMHTCIRLENCILADGPTTRRVDGRTAEWTDGRKENIQTDRVTYNLLLINPYRRSYT